MQLGRASSTLTLITITRLSVSTLMIKSTPTPNPMQLYMSLATVPMLGLLIILAGISPVLMQLGQLSEEVFRGDRLPILPFPWDLTGHY